MKRVIRLFGFSLLFIAITFAGACSKEVDLNNTEKKNIALIVKMNNGYHWGTVKLGADMAGREFNVNIDYNAPEDEEDIAGQIKLVNQALEKKVDALILAANDSKALVNVTEKAYDQRIPVIIIDSEVETNKIFSSITSDNLNAGNQAGKALIDTVGQKCNVAVMNFEKGTGNAEQRERGLSGVISQYPDIRVVAKEYCSSDTELAFRLTKKIIADNGEIGAVVAFNAIASEGVAEAVEQMNLAEKVKIIAFDNTPKEIDYLEKGVIRAIITQNPFSMGYLGVKYAVDAMSGKSIPKNVDTGSKIINRDNMYLPENQKLLFPSVN